jgi:predicted ferric reductase
MNMKKSHIGLGAVILLCLVPVIPWLSMKPLDVRFGSMTAWFTSIGQLSALIGLAMFSVSLILIARLRPLEPFFGGLDRIFKAHRHLGVLGFLLMLIHPLALAVRFIPLSVSTSALFLLPSEDFAKNLGIFSLLLMMGLIGATLFAHWRYQILLKTHRILGIAFMLGVMHAFLIPSDISGNPLLATYSIGLASLGLMAYFYRTVFSKAIPKYHFVVKDVRALDPTVTEVTLDPLGDRLVFQPGQFVFVSFKDRMLSDEVHPFSISSAPHDRELRLTIKALGDWTTEVPCLEVGASATIEGPFGGFTGARAQRESEVWVAGGIGITPFLSRARAYTRTGLTRAIDLYYTANTTQEMLFLHELMDIAKENPHFRVIPHASKEMGLLTATRIHAQSGSLASKDVFVCGPPMMMQSIIRQCKDLGVHASQIHAEEFSML